MAKKRKLAHNIPGRNHPDRPRPKSAAAPPAKQHKQSPNLKQLPNKGQKQQPHKQQQQHEKPTIPFNPHERILLVGEGDLSFAASLVRHHKCTAVTASVLEKNKEELETKYPHVGENIETLLAKDEDPEEKEKEEEREGEDEEEEDEDEDWSQDSDDDGEEGADAANKNKKPPPRNNRIAYNIDATKPLPNALVTPAPFSTIIFNFPHVGGLTTDVNRQVRHNQSLLVSFFTSILSTSSSRPALAPHGSIVVTLFEAEPYTLWNIKDLARHAGLAVEKSFRFQADAYPGYRHARTCGVIEGKGGAWKGEERKARSYVFRRKGEIGLPGPGQGKKKRKKGEDDSDDDD